MTRPDLVRAAFASSRPWECCILAVDPGEASGWSVWVAGSLLAHGAATIPADRELAVTRAWALGGGLPLVAVGETWSARSFKPGPGGGRRLSTATLIGLGAHWGRWLEQLDRMPPVVVGKWRGPKVVRVEPPDWRAQTVGNAGKSEAIKSRTLTRARLLCHSAGLDGPATLDASDAIVIGEWATRAAEVGAVLPAAYRGAA